MPELPDVVVYVEALRATVKGRRLNRLQLVSPFVLRSVDPPLDRVYGQIVRDVRRIGKRIVLAFDPPPRETEPDQREIRHESGAADDAGRGLFLVVHLMIAGRLRWRSPADKLGLSRKLLLAVFEFDHGRLLFTEAGSKKRASLQLVQGEAALAQLDPGGVEPLDATPEEFRAALTRESHTLKRALTDPHLFSGIGNAYSDEILHAARLSPLKLTRALSDQEFVRLYEATRGTLNAWTERLRRQAGGGFPEKVTAFREEMAVHGRFKQPCPVCGSPVQRIVYAENECNYCATCQTGGRLLADRSLSRLLREDWPKRLE